MDVNPIASRRSNMTLLAAGFVLLALVIVATGLLLWREQVGNGWVSHTLEVEARLAKLQSLLLQAESGQRGFLLTGRDLALVPYREARATIEREMPALLEAISDNPRQVTSAEELREMSARRMAFLQRGIDARIAGGLEAAAASFDQRTSRPSMPQVQAVITRMDSEELRLLGERQAAVERLQRALLGAVATMVLIVLLLALVAVRRARGQAVTISTAHAELRQAHDALIQGSSQRELLEAQLRQAQKMEAVGQLTGGLAHDFNNMLAVIAGNLQLMKRRIAQGRTDLGNLIDGAIDGASRAAMLTNRLLAFARRQPLSPTPIDPNKFVAGMSDLLHRSLGEEIRLETILAGGLWRTHADSSQLESALLNLAVNARDAMPNGGRLTIETGNAHLDEGYAARQIDVPPGQYVLIAVSDTGTGMPAEVIARAFDPFFTTKEVGRGTGLGLSQVYGFVRQSGGHVKIYSEPGSDTASGGATPQGTTVKLYLPRYLGAESPSEAMAPARGVPMGAAREVILVVEDEERVRQLAVDLLQELGYSVRAAEGAAAGLRILDADPAVVMVLTDVVMPDLNGRRFADEAQRRRPELKILFMTGYTRNAIVHNDMLDPGVHLLSKPFSLEQLAHKMRDVLGPVSSSSDAQA